MMAMRPAAGFLITPRMKILPLAIVALLAGAGAARAAGPDPPPALARYDCLICHAVDDAKTGPSFVEIAAQHRGDRQAAAKLRAILKKGAHGAGPWHMPPAPQVTDADARGIVAWVLALDPAAPGGAKP